MLGGRLKVRLGMDCSTADVREGSAIALSGEDEPDLIVGGFAGKSEDFGFRAEGWVKGAEHVFVLGGYSGFDGGTAIGEDWGTPGVGGCF
jgi:hypothetical protein